MGRRAASASSRSEGPGSRPLPGGTGAKKFHDGWFQTGDVGNLDLDGCIRLTNRSNNAVKSGGEWISSVGLENQVRPIPRSLEAAVIGVPDERWGERPCVVVTVMPGAAVTGESLRDWLDGRVARWWLPERWVFAAAIPRTSVGKYNKRLLRSQYAVGDLDVITFGPRRPAPSR